jgi:hypothetical protein
LARNPIPQIIYYRWQWTGHHLELLRSLHRKIERRRLDRDTMAKFERTRAFGGRSRAALTGVSGDTYRWELQSFRVRNASTAAESGRKGEIQDDLAVVVRRGLALPRLRQRTFAGQSPVAPSTLRCLIALAAANLGRLPFQSFVNNSLIVDRQLKSCHQPPSCWVRFDAL